MKRGPIKSFKEEYTKRFQITEIFPILFWTSCEKCGNEFRGESMFQGIIPSYPIRGYWHKHGCKECFRTKEEFRKFLIENGYVKKEHLLD